MRLDIQGDAIMTIWYGTSAANTKNIDNTIEAAYALGGNDRIIIYQTPYAGTIIDGGDGTDTLVADGKDISQLVISNFEILDMGDGNTTLTAEQLLLFSSIVNPGRIYATNAGTYDLSIFSLSDTILLYGSTGNDTLIAGSTTTVLSGDAGNDGLYASNATTSVNGGTGDDYIDTTARGSAGTTILTGSGANTVYAGAGNDTITINGTGNLIHANSGNDVITLANASADSAYDSVIYAEDGDDTVILQSLGGDYTFLYGGSGTDTLRVSSNGQNRDITKLTLSSFEILDMSSTLVTIREDQLSSFSKIINAGTLFVDASGSYNLNLIDITGNIRLNGSDGDDILIAGNTTTYINGGDGDDYIDGTHKTDGITISTGLGADEVWAGIGNDIINSYGVGDEIHADAGDDTIELIADSANSSENAAVYADAGNDKVILSSIRGDGVYLDGGSGTDTLQIQYDGIMEDISHISFINFEILDMDSGYVTLTGNQLSSISSIINPGKIYGASAGVYDLSAISVTGNIQLFGSSGNDTLIAGSTTTKLSGGTGNDILVLSSSVTSAEGGDGQDTLRISAQHTNLNTLSYTSLEGLDLNNYSADINLTKFNAFSSIVGTGTIYTTETGTYDLGSKSTANGISLIGTSGNDTLIGTNGSGQLDGGSGNDTLIGGEGSNIYIFSSASGNDIVNNYHTVAASSLLSISSSVSYAQGVDVSRNGDDYVITVSATGQTITVQNYFLADEYKVNDISFADGIRLSLDTLYYNDPILGTNGSDNLLGTSGDDFIYSGNGNDALDGGTGNDYMSGGSGDDIYYVDSYEDILVESSSGGNDSIYSSICFTLYDYFENLLLLGSSSIDATGNSLNNIITGNSGDNVIDGSSGADVMSGGDGDDTYIVDNIADTTIENASEGIDLVKSSVTWTLGASFENLTLTGSSHIDASGNIDNNTLIGNAGNNTIWGDSGVDTIYGGDGNDILIGGDGDDILYGGYGADTFLLGLDTLGSVDTINDFNLSQNDKIDLSQLLNSYDPITDAITDFVQFTESGSDSILNIDIDGGGDNFIQIATISGVTGLTDEAALVSSGNLIVS